MVSSTEHNTALRSFLLCGFIFLGIVVISFTACHCCAVCDKCGTFVVLWKVRSFFVFDAAY